MGPTKRIHISSSGRRSTETVDVWAGAQRVGAYCREVVITVEPRTSVSQILDQLLENAVHAAVVLDDKGACGIVSLTDISRAVSNDRLRLSPEGAAFDPSYDTETHASDVMHSPAVVCEPQDLLTDASRKMSDANVHQLPVVDEEGKVIGLLRSIDVLRAWSEGPHRAGEAGEKAQPARGAGEKAQPARGAGEKAQPARGAGEKA